MDPLDNREVLISVVEPWDFSSAEGPNRLGGDVVPESAELAKADALLLQVTPFDQGRRTYDRLLATSRYVEETTVREQLAWRGGAICILRGAQDGVLLLVGCVALQGPEACP